MTRRQRRCENGVGTSISRHFYVVFDVALSLLNLANIRVCDSPVSGSFVVRRMNLFFISMISLS